MTNRRWIYLIIALLALASTDSVLARRGHGGHHHHHHIGGHHHHGGHGHLRLGINMGGYYNPGFSVLASTILVPMGIVLMVIRTSFSTCQHTAIHPPWWHR